MFATRKLDKPDSVVRERLEVDQVLQFRLQPVTRQHQYEVQCNTYEDKDNSWIKGDDIE